MNDISSLRVNCSLFYFKVKLHRRAHTHTCTQRTHAHARTHKHGSDLICMLSYNFKTTPNHENCSKLSVYVGKLTYTGYKE